MTKSFLMIIFIIPLAYLFPISSSRANLDELNLTDLTVDGNSTTIIRDALLYIKGNIIVKDNATLYLENVNVQFPDRSLDYDVEIVVNGNSNLRLVNVSFLGEYPYINTNFLVTGNSQIEFIDSKIDYLLLRENASLNAVDSNILYYYSDSSQINRASGGISAFDNSRVNIRGCKLTYLQINEEAVSIVSSCEIDQVTASKSSQMQFWDSVLGTFSSALENFSGVIQFEKLNEYTGNLSELSLQSNAEFNNTTIDGLSIILRNSSAVVTDSELESLILYKSTNIVVENSKMESITSIWEDHPAFNLTIKKSDIEYLVLGSNTTLNLFDSSFKLVNIYNQNPKSTISRCIFGELRYPDFGVKKSYIKIGNSIINKLMPCLGLTEPITYIMNNVTILEAIIFGYGVSDPCGGVEFVGDIKFSPTSTINKTSTNGYSVLTRHYVLNLTVAGNPASNIPIEVTKDNKKLWTGETDNMGIANFSVKFADIFYMPTPYDPNNPLVKVNNMTDTVTLRWGTEDKVGELEVGITSDSYLKGEFQSNRNLLPYIVLVLVTGFLLILVWKKWI